jgi:very-short-patch-repair endonuclease
MAEADEVLVAILNTPRDLDIARSEHWYRIPVASADKWLQRRWPPDWLAFYQPKIFGAEAFAVRFYSRVLDVRQVSRQVLFPDDPEDARATQRYYQLLLAPLEELPDPIFSRRWRRIVFIATTWRKFTRAVEINDLYDESPLEDRLWAEFKRLQIQAERQEFVAVKNHNYFLDFAVYCRAGKLNIETDGDTWHADAARIPQDNRRDNDLETAAWKLLRFNSLQLHEQMHEYCLPTIVENINHLGGLDDGRMVPRRVSLDPATPTQLSLFDDAPKRPPSPGGLDWEF